jgi:hypothetical protein
VKHTSDGKGAMFAFTKIGTYAVAPPEEMYGNLTSNLFEGRSFVVGYCLWLCYAFVVFAQPATPLVFWYFLLVLVPRHGWIKP